MSVLYPSIMGLTLWRPWAHWVAQGFKRIENRPWTPPSWMYGKHIAIHAGKAWDPDAEQFVANGPHRDILRRDATHVDSAIIGVGRLVGCVTEVDSPDMLDNTKRWVSEDETVMEVKLLEGFKPTEMDLEWFVGPFGWLLTDLRPIEPVKCRGYQKLWRLEPDILTKVREGYRAAGGGIPA